MTQFSLAELFGITIRESANDGSDFTNPSADYRRLFLGEDGGLHLRDSAGAFTHIAPGAGTAMPASPPTNSRFYRTDLGMEFYYDGTRWLCTCPHSIQTVPYLAGADPGASGDVRGVLNATTSGGGGRFIAPSILGASNIWIVNHRVVFQVGGGGSALSGSHKWVGTLIGVDSASASTGTAATTTIDSGSSSIWRESTVTVGAAQAANTLWYTSTWTKTGTPGDLQVGEVMSYRIIGT